MWITRFQVLHTMYTKGVPLHHGMSFIGSPPNPTGGFLMGGIIRTDSSLEISMKIIIPEGEVCWVCKKAFEIGAHVTILNSDYHRGGKVYFHDSCWLRYCKEGGHFLDFMEPLNNPRYPI